MFSVSVVEALPSLLSGHQLFERSGPPSYPWHGWKHHDLVVDTTSGPVRPLVNTTYPDVEQYLGIPFAAPPIGSLRFGAPQQYSKSSEIINATEIPPSCYQLAATSKNIFDVYEPGFGVQGPQSEDCLKLDLYRPSQSSSKSLPVLIFVYGGAFVIGGANQLYEMPTPWVQHKQDLIVVNIQYVRIHRSLMDWSLALTGDSYSAWVTSASPIARHYLNRTSGSKTSDSP